MFTIKRLLCVIVGLAILGLPAAAQDPRETSESGVLFTGTGLPTPPEQNLAWKPSPSSFSKSWLTALEELIRHGFADPRGCEYREVQLTWGSSIWGGRNRLTTHAWVIPQGSEGPKDSQRFAVTWDGLVYPVVKMGPVADLENDVKKLISDSEKETKEGAKNWIGHGDGINEFPYSYDRPWKMREWREEQLVSCDTLVALKCCLLLRLNKVALAEQLWAAWKNRDGRILKEGPTGDDPYMVFAWEWAWALFDRAVAAHLRGDDVIAMHSTKILVPFQKAVPEVATRRGFKQFRNYGSNAIIPFLPLRDPPSRLLEEAMRRVQEGPVQRVLDVGLKKFPDRSKRIAALIRDLESISAGPEYEKGRWPLSPPHISWYGGSFVIIPEGPPVNPLKVSPIVHALIVEGDAAVEPLLECLVNDRRLTRVAGLSPSTCGDFLDGRDFIGVDLAAYWALCRILGTEHFGPLTEEGYYHGCQQGVDAESANPPALPFYRPRKAISDPGSDMRAAVAAEIRRRWEKVKGRGPEETWLAALADPDMTCKVWLDAARKIVARVHRDEKGKFVEPKNIIRYNNEIRVLETDDDLALPMAGEILRAKKKPSVTELLIARSDSSAIAAKGQEPHFFDWKPVCELTLCLARWDPNAAVPVIHRRFVDLQSPTQNKFPFGDQGLQCLADPIADLLEAALQAGEDQTIIQDYDRWLRATRPSDLSFYKPLLFMPLWRHPDHPKMAELARWLFLSKESPWHSIHELRKPLSTYEMINSPLVGVPAFRALLKRELTNATTIGHFEIDGNSITISAMNAGIGANLPYVSDVEPQKSKRQQPLHAYDFYAWMLSKLEGSPRYELYWPETRREAVRKDMAKFLDQRGNCFRDQSKCLGSYHSFHSRTRFQLPRLAEPATADDVAAGRAIFSLRDQPNLQVRVVPLKPCPTIARWRTYKELALREPQPREWPKQTDQVGDQKIWDSLPQESFDREGLIWQAEEILLDGKWQRYYGFVGSHVIAKVSADEIEILEHFGPAHPGE